MTGVGKQFSVWESLKDLTKETIACFWGFLGLALLMTAQILFIQLIVVFVIFSILDVPSLLANEGLMSLSKTQLWGANLLGWLISYVTSCLMLSALGRAGIHVVREDAVYPLGSLAIGIATTPRMAIVLAPFFLVCAVLTGLSVGVSSLILFNFDATAPATLPQIFNTLVLFGLLGFVVVMLFFALCAPFAPILSVLHQSKVWFGAFKQCLQLTAGSRFKIFLLLVAVFSILMISSIIFCGFLLAFMASTLVFAAPGAESSVVVLMLAFSLFLFAQVVILTVSTAFISLLSPQIHERLQSLNSN